MAYCQKSIDTTYFTGPYENRISTIVETEGDLQKSKTYQYGTIYKNDKNGLQYQDVSITIDEAVKVKGKLHGILKRTVDGVIQFETMYKNGIVLGESKTYANGKLSKVENYDTTTIRGIKKSVYHGWVLEYYPNGFIKSKTQYQYGKNNGLYELYHKNGKLNVVQHYFNGQQIGKYKKWDTTGVLRETYTLDTVKRFKNSDQYETKKVGIWKKYYANGQIAYSASASKKYNYALDGKVAEWYENGAKKSLSYYKNGLLIGKSQTWFEAGNLSSEDSYIQEYDRNTQKYILKKDGNSIRYYTNTKHLQEKGQYKNGFKIGKWLSYYPSGALKEETNYGINGLKSGKHVQYYEDGKVSVKEEYLVVENIPLGKRIYTEMLHGEYQRNNEKGQPLEKGNHYMGKKSGEWLMYFDSGELYQKHNYDSLGYLAGYQEEYNRKGTLRERKWGNQVLENYYANDQLYHKYAVYRDSLFPQMAPRIKLQDQYDEWGNKTYHQQIYKGNELGYYFRKEALGKILKQGYSLPSTSNWPTFSWEEDLYPNGNLKKEHLVWAGHEIGGVVEWYIDGKLKQVYMFNVFEYAWDQDGNMIKCIHYHPPFTKYGRSDDYKDTVLTLQQKKKIYEDYSLVKNRNPRVDSIFKHEGPLYSYYTPEQIKFETYIENGKPNRFFRFYYPNGKPLDSWTLKEGVPHGAFQRFNPDGSFKEEGTFTDAVPTGVWKIYSETGVPEKEYLINYNNKNSEYHAYIKEYYNGHISHYQTYHVDHTDDTSAYYYANGRMSRLSIHLKSDRKYLNEDYYPSGKLKTKYFSSHTGKELGKKESFYENGQNEREENFIKDSSHKYIHTWHSNGKPSSYGFLKWKRESYYPSFEIDSIWSFYDTTGQLTRISKYKNDTLVPQKSDDPCACNEPQERSRFSNWLKNHMDTLHLDHFQFSFHERVDSLLEYIFFDQSGDGSRNLRVYDAVKIGLPNKKGLQLLMNPCFQEGQTSQMRVYYKDSKTRNTINLHLYPYRLAYEFDKELLHPVAGHIKTSRAYFSVDYIKYAADGITFEDARDLCFNESYIGRSNISLKLYSYYLKKVIPQVDNVRQSTDNYDAYPHQLVDHLYTPGIIEGIGYLNIPYLASAEPIKCLISQTYIFNDMVYGTLQLKLNEDGTKVIFEKEKREIDKNQLIQYLETNNFKIIQAPLKGNTAKIDFYYQTAE